MPVVSVQFKHGVSATNGTVVTLDSPATAGNLVLVYGIHSYPGCPPSVVNSEASSVTTKISDSTTGKIIRVFSMVVGSSGTYSVTLNMACGFFNSYVVEEVSGFDPADPIELIEFDVQTTTSTTALSLGPKNALVDAGLRVLTYGGISGWTPTSGWTSPLFNDTITNLYVVQGKQSPSTGAQSCTLGLSNGGAINVYGLLFSIKPSASAPTALPRHNTSKVKGYKKKYTPASSTLLAFRSALPSSGPSPNPPSSVEDELWFFRNRRRYR